MTVDEQGAALIADAVGKHLGQVLRPLDAMTKTLERLSTQVNEVDRRVVRLESDNRAADIERLSAQIQRVEADLANDIRDLRTEADQCLRELRGDLKPIVEWRHQMSGAATLFQWVKSSTPWVLGLVGLAVAYYTATGLPK